MPAKSENWLDWNYNGNACWVVFHFFPPLCSLSCQASSPIFFCGLTGEGVYVDDGLGCNLGGTGLSRILQAVLLQSE